MVVLGGRASAVDASTPYGPLVEALHAAPVASRDDPQLEPYRAALGHLLPLWKKGAPAADARLLLPEATLRLLQHLADNAGVLLVVEDAHWADADTLALLDHVADHLQIRAGAVFGHRAFGHSRTSRRDPCRHDRTPGRGPRRARPLAPDEVAAMARLALGSEEIAALVLGALRGRAEGVPFLVEETLAPT